jgi:hypothetical protein
MDDGMEQDEPKISLVVGVLATIFFILVDLICLIPGVGDVEDIFGFLGGIIGFVSDAGKELLTTLGIVMGIKAIPGIQIAPAWTLGWWFVWYAENHPSAATNVVLEVAQTEAALEGGGGVGEEAGELGAASEAGEGLEGVESGAQAAAGGEGAESAEAIGEAAETTEGIEEAGTAAEKTGKAGAEASEGAATETGAEGGSETEEKNPVDLETPEEKNPMENLQKDLENPDNDFGSWDNGGGNNDEEEDSENDEDDELPMAA